MRAHSRVAKKKWKGNGRTDMHGWRGQFHGKAARMGARDRNEIRSFVAR